MFPCAQDRFNVPIQDHLGMFSDSDYAGCRLSPSPKSLGYLFGTVHWKSKLHAIISLLTMEAELYAAASDESSRSYEHANSAVGT
jgi:hypothetical protein